MTNAPIKGASAPTAKTADRKGIRIKANIGETVLPGSPPTILKRDQITIDPELQPRAGNNKALVDQYAETLKERNWLPDAPLTIVGSDGERWLVDGHNRFHAAAIAGITEIPARIIPGDYQDAVRYSLGVNSAHGLQRSGDDLRLAYEKAVAYGFCAADDAPAVAGLLKCSERWARELTREAREQVKAERDREIQRLAEEGKTQREIAASVGVTHQGVSKILGNKRNPSESCQAPEPATAAVDDGPDWGWPEGASVEPPKAAPARPTAPAKAPAPQPAAQVGAKGPTSWDAGQVALRVGRVLVALYEIDSALEYEPDGRALLANLRYALDRYADKFADKEGNGHA